MSASDKFYEDLFSTTTMRNKDGRYVVLLPFKEGYPKDLNIGQSRTSAMAQYLRNEARLLRAPDFKKEYDNVIQEYEQLKQKSSSEF